MNENEEFDKYEGMSKEDYEEYISEFPQEEEGKANFSTASRMVKVFTAPAELAKDIALKPQILVPSLIIGVLTLVVTLLSYNVVLGAAMDGMMLGSGEFEDLDGMVEIVKITSLVMTVVAALITPFFIIINGLIIHGISSLLGAKGNMKSAISFVLYVSLISLLGSLVANIIMLITGSATVTLSPAMFISDQTSAAYLLASFFNVFSIWYYIVTIIGMAIIEKFSNKRAAIAVLLPGIVMILFSLAMLVVSQAMASMY